MFHDITENDAEKEFAVSYCKFKNILREIEINDYKFVSLDYLLSSNDKKEKLCVITFDDVYKGVYTFAYSYLEEKQIPYILYVATNFINKDDYITKEELRKMLSSELCSIGSHTVNHVMTRFTSEKKLRNELLESKNCLEALSGKEVRHFAFPYGSPRAVSLFDIKYVKEAGYESAATTLQIKLGCNYKKRKYLLPRIDASRKDLMEIVL